jgi:lipopolysaccharide transport system ATP-binding protein
MSMNGSDLAIRAHQLGKAYEMGNLRRSPSIGEALADTGRDLVAALAGRRRRGIRWALRDVSFDVHKGEVLGVIGANGAGKSTLLKVLTRITWPTEGFAEITGRVGSLLEVGTGFHPELTGRENIFLNGAVLGMRRPEIARAFDAIVDFAEIDDFLDLPVKRYSNGMQLRLAFSVAAHLEAEILLVDEVLAVGDLAFQRKCLGKMSTAAGSGRTILLVSHSMATVQRLCSRAVLLKAGRMVADGSVEEVVDLYLDGEAGGALLWERNEAPPPDKPAFVERAWLGGEDGRPVRSVTTAGRLRVFFEVTVKESLAGMQASLGLMDGLGEQIFGTSPIDSGAASPDKPGRYQLHVALPADILLPQRYVVRLAMWRVPGGVFDAVDALRFVPVEAATLANAVPGGRVGKLVVPCDWQVTRL